MSDGEKTRKIELGTSMQRHILGAMLKDLAVMTRIRTVTDPAYFSDEAIADVVAWVNTHWDQHQQLPSRAALMDVFSGEDFRQHRREIKRSLSEDISDPAHTVERITGYARNRAFRLAILRSAEIINAESQGTPLRDDRGKLVKEDPEELIRKAKMVGADTNDIGTFIDQTLVDEMEKRLLNPQKHEKFTTGLEHLDEAGLMLERGEIGCVLGVAKGGKSQVLLNIAIGNAKQGKTVVYYNLEMPEDRMDARFSRRVAGVKADMRTEPEAFIKRLRRRMDKIVRGKILVKRFVANTATIDDIRAHLSLVAAEGVIPDVVIVDYLGILKPRVEHDDRRFDLESNWLDFRALCQQFKVAGWSAAQTNRGGANAELVTMSAIGECFAIVQHIDAGVSISMTQEERDDSKGRFFVFASRNEMDGVVIPFTHNYACSLIVTQAIEKPTKDKKRRGKHEDKQKAAFDEEMDRRNAPKDRNDAKP